MEYEELLMLSDSYLTIREKELTAHDGLIEGTKIAIRQSMNTDKKLCTLAEEIGHLLTSSGDILDQTEQVSRKQELKARMIGYDMIIGIDGIIACYEHGCQNRYQMAEYLNVTEDYLNSCIQAYSMRYGIFVRQGDYIVYFKPNLAIERVLRERDGVIRGKRL